MHVCNDSTDKTDAERDVVGLPVGEDDKCSRHRRVNAAVVARVSMCS